MSGNLSITDVAPLPPMQYRWPATVEQFTGGWEMRAHLRSLTFDVEHAVGSREVYGRRRAHTVTFINGQPSVEGVAADDFDRSQALLSLVKLGSSHKLAKGPSDVPRIYSHLDLVDHRSEIDAPYSKRCIALKLQIDDLEAWALHAITRFIAQGRDSR